jgi:hypothetical protein
MNRLPGFSFADFASLLGQFRGSGYDLQPVSTLLDESTSPVVYLRHDIDFFPHPSLEMGRIESNVGARATYYFLLSGPYNLFTKENRAVLRTLIALGHEVGLHYDLETYPEEPTAARRQLEFEAGLLGELCGTSISTISRHQPHKNGHDPFHGLDTHVNAHDARDLRPLTYVSDSCRAWRDETLLHCLGPQHPERVQFLTHPESWMDGTVQSRLEYLEKVVIPHARRPIETYYLSDVRKIWLDHAGGRAHDARTRLAS